MQTTCCARHTEVLLMHRVCVWEVSERDPVRTCPDHVIVCCALQVVRCDRPHQVAHILDQVVT